MIPCMHDIFRNVAGERKCIIAVFFPVCSDRGKYLEDTVISPCPGPRDITGGKEGDSSWREKDGERPAPSSRECDTCVHVVLVEVRPLLAVELDTDEVIVQESSNHGIRERFLPHHVAPVTRGVPDREKNGFILFPCADKCLVTPGIPVNRIEGMLPEVGRDLLYEPVLSRVTRPGFSSLFCHVFRHTCTG
ncbi:MAG: hypothetical protein A4E39_00357 [Methanoregulaceae archaeon PtaB.Bin152]|nr:MAG: hypothetical protein A4E39_00357 [Methanoregulaceae archaeon PtaB.Bin152]